MHTDSYSKWNSNHYSDSFLFIRMCNLQPRVVDPDVFSTKAPISNCGQLTFNSGCSFTWHGSIKAVSSEPDFYRFTLKKSSIESLQLCLSKQIWEMKAMTAMNFEKNTTKIVKNSHFDAFFFLFGVCARCARHPTAPEDLWCRCQLSGGKNGATSQLSLVPASTPSFLVPKNGNGGHLSFEGDNSFNSFATMNKRNHINHPTLNDFGAKRQIQRYPKYSKMNSWNLLLPVHLWLTPLRF